MSAEIMESIDRSYLRLIARLRLTSHPGQLLLIGTASYEKGGITLVFSQPLSGHSTIVVALILSDQATSVGKDPAMRPSK